MSAHTPGPWVARNWSCHAPTTVMCEVEGKRGGAPWPDVIAECSGNGERFEDGVVEANARLIAAAPDLLEAMIASLREWEFKRETEGNRNKDVTPDWVYAARASIAKATSQPS